jgi:hypothetical protein
LRVVDVLLTGKAVPKISHRIREIVMGTGAVASDLLPGQDLPKSSGTD